MSNFSERTKWRRRAPFIGLFFLSMFALAGGVVMLLWNAILPAVAHVGALTYWQAVGLLVLCRMLFGGFPGRRHHGPSWKHDSNNPISADDKTHFRNEWRKRWHHSPEEKPKKDEAV